LDDLLFKDAESTIRNYLASGKLQNTGEEALRPFIKIIFLPVDWSMRVCGQYFAREGILNEKKMSCKPFPGTAEIERQRCFENLLGVYYTKHSFCKIVLN